MIWGYPHFRKLPNSISSDCILAVFKFIIMLIIKCWRHFWDGSAPSFSITELFRTQEFLTFDQCLLLLSWPSCCAHRLTEGKKSSRKKAAKGSRMSFNWPARLLQSCAFLFLGFFLLEKCWVLLFRALVHPEWHLHRVWYSFWGCRLIWHLCWLVVVSHNFAYVHCFFDVCHWPGWCPTWPEDLLGWNMLKQPTSPNPFLADCCLLLCSSKN